MIRVLFVDDEPNILDGLRRMLRSHRDEWEMEFVAGGQEALAAMDTSPFDVVVCDMKMPGIDGAELLNEVKARHPKSIRIVLSGQADRDAIMRVVGATHQYLAKPCEPDVLKATIDRACALRRVLGNDELKGLVSRLDNLPSLPSLYKEVTEELRNEEPSLKRIGEIVETDMGMSTKILKLVNSAFFGLKRSVSSVEHAVSFLGLDTIKTLVLSVGIFEQFDDDATSCFSLESVWSHCLRTGRYAATVARLEGLEKEFVDQSFTAGLLHDTGKIVLAVSRPEEYGRVLETVAREGCATAPVERELLGATHGEVGGYLMGLWGLPQEVVEAVAFHISPGDYAASGVGPLAVVHVSDALAAGSDPSELTDDSPLLDKAYLNEIGMGQRWHEWQAACVQSLGSEEAA